MTARHPSVLATEIGADDAAWLRGQTLPEGVALRELDEVAFMGRTYDRAPGSSLYVPAEEPAVDRAVARFLEEAEAVPAPPPPPVGIDLFCGAGGFSLGMHEAGFDVAAAVEWDVPAAVTYLHNLARPDCAVHFADDAARAEWDKERQRFLTRGRDYPGFGAGYRAAARMPGGCRAFFVGDVRKVSGPQLLDAAGVTDVAVVFGGPPCQGLSAANSKACLEDPRNGLAWEFMRIVREILPQSFIIENVPQILTVAKGALFNAIARLANEAGYNVTAQKLDASGYGVPQYRRRALIVGTREGTRPFHFPMPSHWAIDRPVHAQPWGIGEEEAALDDALPAEAQFDPTTRTWSVPGDDGGSRRRRERAEEKRERRAAKRQRGTEQQLEMIPSEAAD